MEAGPAWRKTVPLNCPGSTQFHDQEVTSRLESRETPLTEEWTDEKHSLYINSMEASFVNQLYDSFDLVGWRPGKENPSDSQPSSQDHYYNRASSCQIKVLRGGSWQKVNSKRAVVQLHGSNACGSLHSNPWIRHFRCAGRHQVAALPILEENATSVGRTLKQRGKQVVSCGSATSSRRFPFLNTHVCYQDSNGSDLVEMSDQNFIGNEIESSAKRKKTLDN